MNKIHLRIIIKLKKCKKIIKLIRKLNFYITQEKKIFSTQKKFKKY